MNYNILCDKYATRHVYGYCPSWALQWDYRRKHILEELRSYSADIIALQVRFIYQNNSLNIDVKKGPDPVDIRVKKTRSHRSGTLSIFILLNYLTLFFIIYQEQTTL